LRELKRAHEQDYQQWAKSLELLLLEMNAAVNASSAGILTEDEIKDYEKRYLEILEEGKNECPEIPAKTSNKKGKVKRTRPRNLLLRLLNYMGDTLRFISEPDVPFTNNNAEREIRMTKVQQKISGCFRSMRGAEMFCLIRSYIITSGKHGISPIEALKMLFRGERPAYMDS
jgi:transposase